MKKNIFIIILVIIVGALIVAIFLGPKKVTAPLPEEITQTEEVELTYVNATADNIVVDFPSPGMQIGNPVTVSGKARGPWYFEASFPIMVYDDSGNQIGMGVAQAEGEWMTEEFVPFSTVIVYTAPATKTGTIVLKNDNPSGEARFDRSVTVPVVFME